MSELTPEQQAELALVRAIADSLRRRMPDLGDRTLGRVAFHIADLLNGVAVVLTADADAAMPANWEAPRPQPIDSTQPMSRPPAQRSPYVPGQQPATGEFPVQPRLPATGEFPVQRPVQPTGEFPAVQATGEFPAIQATSEFPAVRPTGEFPTVRPTGEFPTVRPTGEFPAVRPTGEFPAVRPTGEFPAVRPTGEYRGARGSGEFPTQPPTTPPAPGKPRIRFPERPARQAPQPFTPPREPRTQPNPLAADPLAADALAGDRLAEMPTGPWIADFYQQDGSLLEQAQWSDRSQALRGVAGRVSWLAFDGTDVTVRLRGPGGIDMDHEAVFAAIERLRRG
ncbi:hypothetical protein AB0K60_20705 [Thermopolyspora sp. NPDC052614]|uniref:hypothetical protein n=1 Tax=Thermopolyspora sp. NPDC052614 TaxID=3155682 RepID=UPI003429D550